MVRGVFIQSIFSLRGNQGKGTEAHTVSLEVVLEPCQFGNILVVQLTLNNVFDRGYNKITKHAHTSLE